MGCASSSSYGKAASPAGPKQINSADPSLPGIPFSSSHSITDDTEPSKNAGMTMDDVAVSVRSIEETHAATNTSSLSKFMNNTLGRNVVKTPEVPTKKTAQAIEDLQQKSIGSIAAFEPKFIPNQKFINGGVRPVVVDMGSGLCKAGYAGEQFPRSVFQCVVGRPRHTGIMASAKMKELYVGDEAQAKRGILSLSYPVEKGLVTSWDSLEKIWQHMFNNMLRVSPEDSPVLVSESPVNTSANRETMATLMFETFNIPALYMCNQAVLTMYATGKKNGLVVDCGDGVCSTVPVYEGYALTTSAKQLRIGGRDITSYLVKLATERGYSIDKEIIRDVKEKIGYVAFDFETEMKKAGETSGIDKSYMLPDGNIIVLGNERFRCAEALFKPTLVGMEASGLHDCIFQSVMKCAIDVRRELLGNIFLSGGTGLFPGLAPRLHREIKELVPDNNIVSITPTDRFGSWIGGSIFASHATFETLCITRDEYDEFGPTIVHKKCKFV